ncbi:hypothetical protein IKT64_02970 [Candidatus Saccharibacteria bacterium]|nr:hypothetical protein [Candidatus Saccharibacteria bacterium]
MDFKFVGYDFDDQSGVATFKYQNQFGQDFAETIEFVKPVEPYAYNPQPLENALKLSFFLIGTSYYKAHPTKTAIHDGFNLDEFQAEFFNKVYQEGLSQYAYENQLTRDDLLHFTANASDQPTAQPYDGKGVIMTQSGGKDSLLVTELLNEKGLDFTPLYVAPSDTHPAILDRFKNPLITMKRHIDREALKAAGGLNGHVPITYIIESLVLVQAILLGKNTVLMGIGQEGNEAHAMIGDLKVNHQWSKTWEAEQMMAEYVKRYISPDIKIGSPVRAYSEVKISELFAKKCWEKYGHQFSSCNVANYTQGTDNSGLKWCGKCAKCANSFLVFAPFVPAEELKSIFGGKDLFAEPELVDDFKGLLGVEGAIKPFECVGEVGELRAAYHMKQPGYADLPFDVPVSDFDYNKTYPHQDLI